MPFGAKNTAPSGRTIKPIIRTDETPTGFNIKRVSQAYIQQRGGRTGGLTSGAGLKMGLVDGGLGGGSGGGDHAHHGNDGDHDDDGDHDHHDHHDSYYYTSSYAPYGWWYLYGDYDGDGYRDYVCTNGSYSIYWYGWSGYSYSASPWYGWYGAGYGSGYGYSYLSGYGYPYSSWYDPIPDQYRGAVYGSGADLSVDPSYSSGTGVVAPDPEPVPMTALEVARLEMSIGDPSVAIDAYRSHLSDHPNDWGAVRELGLAKIRAGDRGDGIALISYSYTMDPKLAHEAVSRGVFEDSDRVLRDAVVDTVGWGHRNPSASAWLAVAVLMQSEGRDGPALRMIDRAKDYGLDPEVESAMRSALTHQ